MDEEVHLGDPFLWRGALWVTLTAILFWGLARVTSLVLYWPVLILSGSVSTLIPIFAGGLIGALLGGVRMRRSKYGVERRL